MTTSAPRPFAPVPWFSRRPFVCLALLAAGLSGACAAPAPPSPRLEKGVPVERELRGGQRHEYRMELPAGWYARLHIPQPGVDVAAVLYAPEGSMVAGTAGPSGIDEEEVVSLVTSRQGEYRLVVTPRDPQGPPGRYLLVLRELRPAAATDRRRVAAERAMEEGRRYARVIATVPLAIERYGVALGLWQAIGDRRGEVDSLNLLGPAYAADGAKAVDTCRQAIQRARQAGYHEGEARALKNCGDALSNEGRLQEARAMFERSLALWQAIGDRSKQHVLLQNIGQIYLTLRQPQRALDIYRQSLALATAPAERANALAGTGACHWALRDFDAALTHLLRARALIHETGDGENEGRILGLIADIYQRRGQLQEALRACRQGLGVAKAQDARAYLLYLQANLLIDLGDLEQALANYQEALRLYHRIGERHWQNLCRAGIGWVRLHQGEYRKALAEYEQIAGGGFSYPRALVYWALDQPGRAAGLLEKALAQARAEGDLAKEGEIQLALGTTYRDLGRSREAARSLTRSVELGRRLDYPGVLTASLFRLAQLERDGGRLGRARDLAEEALGIVESLRSRVAGRELGTSFFASRRSYYELYVDLLLRLDQLHPGQGYLEAALSASERARARVLLDLLAESRFAREGRRPGEPRQSPQRSDLRAGASASLGLDEIRALLDEDTALLEYTLSAERSNLFVVTRERLEVFPLIGAEEIDRKVHRLRQLISKPQGRRIRAYAAVAHDLYQDLVAPAADILAHKRRLVIAPDRSLYLLPFEVLLTAPATGDRLGEMPFLIQRYAISNVPSASVLARLREPAPGVAPRPAAARRRFVAFADPPPQSSGLFPRLPPLPEARREVTQIARLYGTGGARLYEGTEATEDNVKDNDQVATAGYLHFATHSLLDEKQPERSGLVLARRPGSREDGFLQAFEVFDLDLSADLVVLSACDSGGKEVTGEGLVGLTRAFLYAGAPTVAVSLWKVDDASSADLMVHFYHQLARTSDKAEALRRSKRLMIADPALAHPFYWSSFVLVGDPGRRP
ncbi:MAG TPA: CHAT domain-containing protein [Thermoanaerobaculia bacterium]|nr:CHAT domain-containing protein [Thermoanaerobaculia bacterium]